VSGTGVEVYRLGEPNKTGRPAPVLAAEQLLGLRAPWRDGRLGCGCLERAGEGQGQKRSPSSWNCVPPMRHCSAMRACLGVGLPLRRVGRGWTYPPLDDLDDQLWGLQCKKWRIWQVLCRQFLLCRGLSKCLRKVIVKG